MLFLPDTNLLNLYPGVNEDVAEKQTAQEAATLMKLAEGASTILNKTDGSNQPDALQVGAPFLVPIISVK